MFSSSSKCTGLRFVGAEQRLFKLDAAGREVRRQPEPIRQLRNARAAVVVVAVQRARIDPPAVDHRQAAVNSRMDVDRVGEAPEPAELPLMPALRDEPSEIDALRKDGLQGVHDERCRPARASVVEAGEGVGDAVGGEAEIEQFGDG